MPWARYQASPIGRSACVERRPSVYTGGCSSSSSTSPSSSSCTRVRRRSWSASASVYSTRPRWQTSRSLMPPRVRPPAAAREVGGRQPDAALATDLGALLERPGPPLALELARLLLARPLRELLLGLL